MWGKLNEDINVIVDVTEQPLRVPLFHKDGTAIPWGSGNPQGNGTHILTVASNLFFDERVVIMIMMMIPNIMLLGGIL